MEPDPMEGVSQPTIESVASRNIDDLMRMQNELDKFDNGDPRFADLDGLLQQLINKLSAFSQVREGKSAQRRLKENSLGMEPYGQEAERKHNTDEQEDWEFMEDIVKNDMEFGNYRDGVKSLDRSLWELYDEVWEALEEDFESAAPQKQDQEEANAEVASYDSPYNADDYYDPEWGDSRNEDY